MQNIPTKNTGDSLTAAEFNQIPDELENAITDTGQSLSGGDLFQLSKAIANMVASGDFYTDSGAADAYVLGTIGSKKGPTLYATGTRVRFVVGNTNTGASTANINALGVKSITLDGAALIGSELVAGRIVELRYDSSGGTFELVIADTLGIRQTWQDVIGSRAYSTLFTNTTGRPILVAVTIQANAAGVSFASFNLDGSNVALAGQGNVGAPLTYGNSTMSIIVPNGSTYRIDPTGTTPDLQKWFELR